MSQNLLTPDSSNMPTPINVVDNDTSTTLPEDLIAEADMPFWKQPNMKIWLYVLGGSIVIFIVIFVLLSQQSSLFKGSTIDTTVVGGGDQDLFFGDYGATTTPDPTTTAPAETVTSTNDQAIQTANDVLITDPDGLMLDPADIASVNFEDINDFTEIDNSIEQDLFGQGYNDAGELLAFTDGDLTTGETNEPSLVTNTNASVMQAPNVQGNTGPALWLALCPSLLFMGYRFARTKA